MKGRGNMKQYALYLRKSQADLELEKIGKFETLARHEKILTELAAQRELKIGKVYKELVSGESIDARPQMQELLDDVYMGKWAGILVMEVERLARGNTKEQGIVAEAIMDTNTFIITPLKTYDPQNESDMEYFEFGLFMSRREYKTITRRMHTGVVTSVKEGNYIGSHAPFGYDKVRLDRKTKTLRINEQEAAVVRLVYDWFVKENLSQGQIAKKLHEMGAKTKLGNTTWRRQSIRDILTNETYIGKVRWARRANVKEYDGKSMVKKRKRQDEYICVDGKHQSIITKEIFDKAQAKLKLHAPVNVNTKFNNTLAGLLVCSNCKKLYYLQPYKHRPNTRARFVHHESTTCNSRSLYYDDVMQALSNSLKAYIDDFSFKLENDGAQDDLKHYEQLLESMTKNLHQLEMKRTRLFEYLENGIYTQDEFLERKNAVNVEINELKAAIEKQQNSMPAATDYEEKIYTFTNVLESLHDETIDAKHKNILLKQIIERIELTITCDYGRQRGCDFDLDIFLK